MVVSVIHTFFVLDCITLRLVLYICFHKNDHLVTRGNSQHHIISHSGNSRVLCNHTFKVVSTHNVTVNDANRIVRVMFVNVEQAYRFGVNRVLRSRCLCISHVITKQSRICLNDMMVLERFRRVRVVVNRMYLPANVGPIVNVVNITTSNNFIKSYSKSLFNIFVSLRNKPTPKDTKNKVYFMSKEFNIHW